VLSSSSVVETSPSATTPFYFMNLAQRTDRRAHMERQLTRPDAAARFAPLLHVDAIDGMSADFSPEQVALFTGVDYLRDAVISQHFGMRGVRRFMANQLTHKAIWRAVAEDTSADYAVVAQDDFALAPDAVTRFDALLADVEALTRRDGPPWVVWLAIPAFRSVPGLEVRLTERFDMSDGAAGAAAASYATPLNLSGGKPDSDGAAPARSITRLGSCERARGCIPCSTAYLLSREGAHALLAEAEARGFDRITDAWMDRFLERHDRHLVATPLIGTVDPSLGSDIFVDSAAQKKQQRPEDEPDAPATMRDAEFGTSFEHVIRLEFAQQMYLHSMTVDVTLTPEANVASWAAADTGFPQDAHSAAVLARGVQDATAARATQRSDACARSRAWESVPNAATNGVAAASGAMQTADARRGDAPMLRPLRGARDMRGNLVQLTTLLHELELAAQPAAWALVGVGDGAVAGALLSMSVATDSVAFVAGWGGPTLHCVDEWDTWLQDGEFKRCNHAAAQAAVAPFASRAVVHELSPVDGAARFANGSLAFVYLDASHGFAELSAELTAWWPTVRVGGVIAGSNYFNGFVPALSRSLGVRDAVDVFFGGAGVDHRIYSTLEQDIDHGVLPIWYMLKCAE
jgi:hypothetical protein